MTGRTPSWNPPADSGIAIRFVETNGLTFEVAEAGAKEGGGDHLALMLHGFPELHYSWRHQIPLLVEKGYRVTVLEQNRVGWGASGRCGGQVIGGVPGADHEEIDGGNNTCCSN